MERLQRTVLQAFRQKLYALIAHVRDELLSWAKQERRLHDSEQGARLLREVEREIANLKDAPRFGKATATTTEMLEDAERRRACMQGGRVPHSRENLAARLEKALDELPDRVQAYLEDLEIPLAQHQVERGKDILASLGTQVVVREDGTVEIRGDLWKTVAAVSPRTRDRILPWLGIIRDLRTALLKDPIPRDVVKELLVG